MMTKDEATIAGQILLNKMNGIGWELRIWENMGWHYEVKNKYIIVSPITRRKGDDKPQKYYCLFNTNEGGGGHGFWTEKGQYFTDPNEAVKRQLETAQEFVDKCQYSIDWVTTAFCINKKIPE